jgi:hypothetical protein
MHVVEGDICIFAGKDEEQGHHDGPADSALFNMPTALTVGDDGSVFVYDLLPTKLRKIQNGKYEG